MLRRDFYHFLKDVYKQRYTRDFVFLEGTKSDLLNIFKEFKVSAGISNSDELTPEILFSLRELHGLPKSVPLFDLIKIVQLKLIHPELQVLSDYQEFINLPLYKSFTPLLNYPVDLGNIHHLIEQQVANPYKELITNAIDACREKKDKIGKFGKGFLSLLSVLGKDNQIIIATKKNGLLNEVILTKEKKNYQFQNKQELTNERSGTAIRLSESYKIEQVDLIVQGISRDFASVQGVSIVCNGKAVNNPSHSEYRIVITINENGFSIEDNGIGMNAEDICTKLFIPDSSNSSIRYFDESVKMREELVMKTHYVVDYGEEKETEIVLEVGGVGFQTLTVKNNTGISRMRLGFPNFTHIPEGRNAISGTKEVMLSLKLIVDKLFALGESKTILDQLSVLVHALHYFEENPSSDVFEQEYDVSLYVKEKFAVIKESMAQEGLTILPYEAEISDFLGYQNNQTFYVDAMLLPPLRVEQIPGVKVCENIDFDDIIGPKKQWYRCSCDPKAEFPVYIGKDFILIDEKYKQVLDASFDVLPKTKKGVPTKQSQRIMAKKYEILAFLNGLVNVSTDYEMDNEKVWYGMIVDSGKLSKQNVVLTNDNTGINNKTQVDSHEEAYLWFDEKLLPYIETHFGEGRNKIDEELRQYLNDRKKHCVVTLYNESKSGGNDFKLIAAKFLSGFIIQEHSHGYSHLAILKEPIELLLSGSYSTRTSQELRKFISLLVDFTATAHYKESGVFTIQKMFGLLHENKQHLPKLLPLMKELTSSRTTDHILTELFILDDDIRELNSLGRDNTQLREQYISRLYEQKDAGKSYQGSLLADENEEFRGDVVLSAYDKNTPQGDVDQKDKDFVKKYGFSLYKYIDTIVIDGRRLSGLPYASSRIARVIDVLSGNPVLIKFMHFVFQSVDVKEDCEYVYIPAIITNRQRGIFEGSGVVEFKNAIYHWIECLWIDSNAVNEPLNQFLKSNNLTKESLRELIGNELANHIDYFHVESQLLYAKHYAEKTSLGNAEQGGIFNDFDNISKETYGGDITIENGMGKEGNLVSNGFYEDIIKGLTHEYYNSLVSRGNYDEVFMHRYGFSLYGAMDACFGADQTSTNISTIDSGKSEAYRIISFYIAYGNLNAGNPNYWTEENENEKYTLLRRFAFQKWSGGQLDSCLNEENKISNNTTGEYDTDMRECYEFPTSYQIKRFLEFSNFMMNAKYAAEKYRKPYIENHKTPEQLEKECFAKLYANPDMRNDHIAFFQFMRQGGKFLENGESVANSIGLRHDSSISWTGSVTDLMYRSRFMGGGVIDNLNDLTIPDFDKDLLQRGVATNIAGQDKSTMLYLREGVQNARDVIKKAMKEGDIGKLDAVIDIDFQSYQGAWMTRISDPVGMSLDTVINKLLVPGKSGKGEGDTGMFGIGLYTFFPGAQEVKIKTSLGKDNQIIVLSCKPITNNEGVIVDVACIIETFTQDPGNVFQGTIIERIDEDRDFGANLQAMIGVNALQKYVGLVDDVFIYFNGDLLNPPSSKKILAESHNSSGLKLVSAKDGISRFAKDGLFISGIPNQLLAVLPDRMKDLIKKENLSIEIPSRMQLVRSRTGLAFEEAAIKELQPMLFDAVVQYILEKTLYHNFHPPMLPEDYFYNFSYDVRQKLHSKNYVDIQNAISDYNLGNVASVVGRIGFTQWLQNKEDIILFLLGCICRKEGKTMIDIRNEKEAKSHLSEKVSARIEEGKQRVLLETNEISYDFDNLDDVARYLNVERGSLELFIAFQKKLCRDAGGPEEIQIGFYYKNDRSSAHAGGNRIEWNCHGDTLCLITGMMVVNAERYLKGQFIRRPIYSSKKNTRKKLINKKSYGSRFSTLEFLNAKVYIDYLFAVLLHELEHVLEKGRGVERTTHTTDMESGMSFLRGIKKSHTCLLQRYYRDFSELMNDIKIDESKGISV